MKRTSRIFVAGAGTLTGAALVDHLNERGYENLVGLDSSGPDLTVSPWVEDFFGEARPEYVFLTAGLSGGIALNQAQPADLMIDNLLSTVNVLRAAHVNGVRKLLYLGSSCSYPVNAAQPMRTESLMTGSLEPTSAAYATAKLAGWQLCAAYRRQHRAPFITAIPANPFGPHDDFGPESGHVIPALIRRAHEACLGKAATLTIWGTGSPRREFIYSRDLADACVFVMNHYDGDAPINLGTGQAHSIAQAARAVMDVVGFTGNLNFDTRRPDGAPTKVLDSRLLLDLGWRPSTEFITALTETYNWFLESTSVELARP
jgi:GDP-L-fucose synthase